VANTTLSASSGVQPLIEGYQQIDPRLYDILSRLSINIEDINAILNPIQEIIYTPLPPEGIPDTPLNFTYATTTRNLILEWDAAQRAQFYELRVGSNWDTAQFVTRTISFEVRLDPIQVGITRYLLKSINASGIYSENAAYVDVEIHPIGSITLNGRVIDNNVLLNWSTPDSVWEIDFYSIVKFGNVIGLQRGTFVAAFENAAGTFTYSVFPTDIAGNVGPSTSVTLVVSQPPDFELLDFRKSILAGLKVNAAIYGSPIIGWVNDEFVGWDANLIAGQNWTWISSNTGKILVCVNDAILYNAHFTSKGWNSIQDQVSGGYPVYIQPSTLTGKYQEIVDYGLVMNSTLFNMNYTIEQQTAAGTVTEIPGVESSLDRITWTPIVHAKSVFLQSFRYVRITIDFTQDNDKALAVFYNLTYSLDIKHELDSGNIIALASDVNGTVVNFNKHFKDVDSITLSATKSTEPLTLIYDFQDIPNPVSFKIFVFNSIGTRVDAQVSWKARGVV
jgi:hypothetical protein